MTSDNRLERLRAISQMVKDKELAKLRTLAQARDETHDRVQRLMQPVALVQDPALFAARQLHAKWALEQRIRLNRTLAQQTARLIEQRAKAARSLGKAEIVANLCRQHQN